MNLMNLSIKFKCDYFHNYKNFKKVSWSNIDKDYVMGWPHFSVSLMEATERNYPELTSAKSPYKRTKLLQKFGMIKK